MKKAISFLLSLIVHIILIIIFYFIYTFAVVDKKKVTPTNEKRELYCLSLKKCHTKPKQVEKKVIKKKIEKKVKKKILKKKVIKKHKRTIKKLPKKKVFIKKEIKQKTLKPEKPIVPKERKEKKELKKQLTKEPQTPSSVQKNLKKESIVQPQPLHKKVAPVKSYQQAYIDKNLAAIRNLIKENMYYPRKARKRHIEGKVVLRVVITKTGKIKMMNVVSSKSDVLSYAAKQVMIMIEGKLPKPKEEIVLTIPFLYRLH